MRIGTKIFAAALGAVVLAGPALADGKGEIDYRKNLMKAVGGHMKALVAIAKGQTANKGDMKIHADAMIGLSKAAANAFPEGSDSLAAPTETLDKVWSDPAGFKKVVMAFQMESAKVATAAASGDTKVLAGALGGLGKNGCKACHDGFREKKK
ncbi:MAG: cytochrome c [Rhodospirillaceae bacterium]